MNPDQLQPQEPGYECWNCGTGLWARDQWRTWALYRIKSDRPTQPLCQACAMKRYQPHPEDMRDA